MSERFDVVVAGGGPGGGAAAIALARAGHSVALVERSNYDRTRIGETLPPGARLPLLQLGLWERFTADGHAPSAGLLSAWGQAELSETHFIFNPYGHGWHIARNRFDAMLAQRAEEQGARVYRGADVTACAPSPGGWQVAVSIGGQPSALNAAFLVDATGRAASVARRLGARRVTADRLTGIAGFFADRRDPAARDSRTLVEAAPDGWWYSAELPDDRLIAVYLTDADLLPKGRLDVGYWQARLAQTTHTRGRVSGGALESLRAFNANSSRLDRFSGPGWLAVGDAAAAVDPLSSQGISRALESGLQAAQAIEQYLGGNAEGLPAYARWLERGFEDYLRRRAIYYGWERRWPDSVFWQRRQ